MRKKIRLDSFLVENQLVSSRTLAQKLIMAGDVTVDGNVILKPSTEIMPSSNVVILQKPRYVSRGGEKLEAALASFKIQVENRICADVGSSTGGFTDCLIQHGAGKVFAIDVGKGILDWQLRNNPKVIVMEKINARYLEQLPEPVSLITIDVSFISLKLLLPVVVKWCWNSPPRELIALIKPQFEVGKEEASRAKGIIRDEYLQKQVVTEVLEYAKTLGFIPQGYIPSPVLGQKGNQEFLGYFTL